MGNFVNTAGNEMGQYTTYCLYTDRDVKVTGNVQVDTQTFRNVECSFLKDWNPISTCSVSSVKEHVETWVTRFQVTKW